jgi:hypothetical protein
LSALTFPEGLGQHCALFACGRNWTPVGLRCTVVKRTVYPLALPLAVGLRSVSGRASVPARRGPYARVEQTAAPPPRAGVSRNAPDRLAVELTGAPGRPHAAVSRLLHLAGRCILYVFMSGKSVTRLGGAAGVQVNPRPAHPRRRGQISGEQWGHMGLTKPRGGLFVPKAARRVGVHVCPEHGHAGQSVVMPQYPPESAAVVTHLVAQWAWQSRRGPSACGRGPRPEPADP